MLGSELAPTKRSGFYLYIDAYLATAYAASAS
jgi:hypothetical protein